MTTPAASGARSPSTAARSIARAWRTTSWPSLIRTLAAPRPSPSVEPVMKIRDTGSFFRLACWCRSAAYSDWRDGTPAVGYLWSSANRRTTPWAKTIASRSRSSGGCLRHCSGRPVADRQGRSCRQDRCDEYEYPAVADGVEADTVRGRAEDRDEDGDAEYHSDLAGHREDRGAGGETGRRQGDGRCSRE